MAQSWDWNLGIQGPSLTHPTPLLPPVPPTVRDAHRVEAAELVAGHGDHHGDDLPADEGGPEQLQHGHQVDVPLHAALGQGLLHLSGHVLLAQERPEGCAQGGAGAVSREQAVCVSDAGPCREGLTTQTHTLLGTELAGASWRLKLGKQSP